MNSERKLGAGKRCQERTLVLVRNEESVFRNRILSHSGGIRGFLWLPPSSHQPTPHNISSSDCLRGVFLHECLELIPPVFSTGYPFSFGKWFG